MSNCKNIIKPGCESQDFGNYMKWVSVIFGVDFIWYNDTHSTIKLLLLNTKTVLKYRCQLDVECVCGFAAVDLFWKALVSNLMCSAWLYIISTFLFVFSVSFKVWTI